MELSSALIRPASLETNRLPRSGVSMKSEVTDHPDSSAISPERSVPAFSSERVGAVYVVMLTTQYTLVVPGRKYRVLDVSAVGGTYPLLDGQREIRPALFLAGANYARTRKVNRPPK